LVIYLTHGKAYRGEKENVRKRAKKPTRRREKCEERGRGGTW
jgi:hypothetical protein